MEDSQEFIPFIHNYCDRWCERCEFTERCVVFLAESKHDLENSDDPIRDGVRAVAIALADAKRMLLEKAEEMGVDLESMIGDPELADNIERRRAAADDNDAVRLAKSYALEARSVLKTSLEWNRGENDPIAAEMLEILDWYVFFIAAKVHRGHHGIANLDGTEEIEELLDSQSDANGSIKVGLIAIERSILAWTYLLSTDNINVVRPQIERLEKIRSLIETKFPNARDFVRPGFDEIETVM
jgi:hypothetical protein